MEGRKTTEHRPQQARSAEPASDPSTHPRGTGPDSVPDHEVMQSKNTIGMVKSDVKLSK